MHRGAEFTPYVLAPKFKLTILYPPQNAGYDGRIMIDEETFCLIELPFCFSPSQILPVR